MPRLVMKFGGTSVADIERIRSVARHVKREVDAGHEVAVVVSRNGRRHQCARRLVPGSRCAARCARIRRGRVFGRTGDVRPAGDCTRGDRHQCALVARLAIADPYSNAHASARILDIDGAEIVKRFKERQEVAVIAGFQGLHKETGRITTLGRGGSDTSAVAVAAAIAADRCDIYTDVDGVYTTDPRVVGRARRLERIAYEEMLELASLGAKVMQVRSVELAMVHNVRIFVRSSFQGRRTSIRADPARHPHLRRGGNRGTAGRHRHRVLQGRGAVSIRRVQDKPGVAAAIFGPLAEANINVDMIVQNVSGDGATTDLTFTVPAADYQRAADVLIKVKDRVGYERVDGANDVAKVSVIGIGMRSHAGVAARAFQALAEKGINIRAITTSEIKFSLLIDANYTELAVRTLHSLYELDK